VKEWYGKYLLKDLGIAGVGRNTRPVCCSTYSLNSGKTGS